jgi:NADPH:quinone reductase-like Zn-dependent oxidoreductase
MDKMKIISCTAYGGPEVLKLDEATKPVPKAQQILIKIKATAVNSGDVRVRRLKANPFTRIIMRLIFGWNKPRNPVLGTVYAGIVEAVGQRVKDFRSGDEVFGLTGFNFGTYAEYLVVNEKSIVTTKPKNATFEESAAILFGGQTAHFFLQKTKIPYQAGLRVMIYGATSSVGVATLQMSKYFGAHVTAVCSDYNAPLVQKLGADRIIFYNTSDFTADSEQYDFIFDAVGKIKKGQCAHLLKKEGQFLTVGGTTYAKENFDQIFFLKKIFETGNYDAVIDRIYEMSQIVQAHQYVESERKLGNVVIRVS